MRFLVKSLFVLVVGCYSSFASADDVLRNSMLHNMAQVNIAKDLGRVVYDHSKSRSQFASVAGKGFSKNTLGVTISKLQIDGTTETNISKVPGGYLVYITDVNMQLFYGDIVVLIDKKYPVGSCEYNAIIAHENKHVGIARMVIDFYAPYVKKEIERIIKDIEPVVVRSNASTSSVNFRFSTEIQNRLKPMMALIQDQLEKGNAMQDTPEIYAQDTAGCSNW